MRFEHKELRLAEVIEQLQALMEEHGNLVVKGEYDGIFDAEEVLAEVVEGQEGRFESYVVLELN